METCLLHNLKNKLFIAHSRVRQIIDLVAVEPIDLSSLRSKLSSTDQALTDMGVLIQPELKSNQVLKDLAMVIKNCIQQFNDFPVRIILEIKSYVPKLVNEECIQVLILDVLKNACEAEADVCVMVIEGNKLTMTDNGQGMSHEALNLAIQGKTFTTKMEGSGVGLMVINEICKSQNWLCKLNHGKDGVEKSGLKYTLIFN